MIELLFLKTLMANPIIAAMMQAVASNWTIFLDLIIRKGVPKGTKAQQRRAKKKQKLKKMQHTQRIQHARGQHHEVGQDGDLCVSEGAFSVRPSSQGINEDWVSKVGALRQEVRSSRAAAVSRGKDFFNGR